MRTPLLSTAVAALGIAAVILCGSLRPAHARNHGSSEHSDGKSSKQHSEHRGSKEHSEGDRSEDFVPAIVFQAAGPTIASIQSTVDAFREALGIPNNGNLPGPLASGRREINWDGGGANDTTTAPLTPFDVFLDTRGGLFTTPGTGLSQAPPAGGPQDGLVGLFDNPTYGAIFAPFSPLRVFTPVDSNVTEALFFVPGTQGGDPATVRGFGAVFTDVDRQDGGARASKRDKPRAGTLIEYFGAVEVDDHHHHHDDEDEGLLFRGVVPASPGDASLSFFGIVLDDARISRVRITSGNVAPGPDDDRKHDVVVMDDFIYGEPQPAD